MYDKFSRVVVSIIFLLLFVVPSFVFSLNPTDVPLPTSISSQQITDVMHTVLQSNKKEIIDDIGKKIDEDFSYLDKRLIDSNTLMFRKGIFALMGLMAIILFGYAYVQNKIQRNYDIAFYEKMIDSKLRQFNKLDNNFFDKEIYASISTKADFKSRFSTPEDYIKDITQKKITKDLYAQLKRDVVEELKKKEKQPEKKKFIIKQSFMQRNKKKLYWFGVFLFLSSLVAVYFYLKHRGVI